MRQGFSLVELSIVLVILGLLTGGILAGQSLIHAAELRKITRDVDTYRSSVYSFRDKYLTFPGDLSNATGFWGKDSVNCNGAAGTASASGTCNGNGDGLVSNLGTGEPRFFWQHLALAGLINGSYTLPATGGYYQAQLVDTQIPRGAISSSSYFVHQAPQGASATAMLYTAARDRLNIFFSNAGNGQTTTSYMGLGTSTTTNALIPEDAWNIDTKMDDGLPGQGSVTNQRYSDGATLSAQNCSSSPDETIAVYNLTRTTKDCSVVFSLR